MMMVVVVVGTLRPTPKPGETQWEQRRQENLGLQHPVGLRLEGLDSVMSLHAEPQGRGLTRPEGDERAV